jgi:electron transfer flavoprotein-quinone oxidoreductase
MEKFEVIIVGAGLAGLAAAWTLAGSGVEVLVLERGDYPGAKNVSGGRLYMNPVRDLFPGLWEDAPLERHVVHEGITLMAKERAMAFEYSGSELRAIPHQSYTVLRARFDRWFAEQAEARGAMLLTKVCVEDVIKDHDKMIGVIAGGDELHADVVMACDGVLSLVSEKAGLHPPRSPHGYAVGVKEVINLPEERINDRFHLDGNEGAARLYAGAVTDGRFGGGFLYTNRESISLGMVVGLDDPLKNDQPIDIPALLDAFKARPEIAPLIKGGTTSEYAAHVIPEEGFRGISPLCGNGILIAGDAAGFALNLGFTVRGMEYALASGYYAAQAFMKAKEEGNFSADALSIYGRLLDESFVMKDFRNFQHAPDIVANPRFFTHYPELAGNLLRDIYSIPAGPKENLYPTIRRHIGLKDLWPLFKDMKGITKL